MIYINWCICDRTSQRYRKRIIILKTLRDVLFGNVGAEVRHKEKNVKKQYEK